MIAVVLVGGKGKRLGELSGYFPKPLLWVPGGRLIERQIYSLINSGVDQIVICGASRNTENLKQFLSITFDKIDFIIGGTDSKSMLSSLLCCGEFVNDDFLVLHGDNIFTEDVVYINDHTKQFEMAVFVAPKNHMPGYPVYYRNTDGFLYFPKGEYEYQKGVVILGSYYISSTTIPIIKYLVEKRNSKTPIDLINHLIKTQKKVKGMPLIGRHFNINTTHDLYNASEYILKSQKKDKKSNCYELSSGSYFNEPFWIDRDVEIINSRIGPTVAIGKNAEIDSCHIEKSIVFPESKLSKCVIRNCIVTPDITIELV